MNTEFRFGSYFMRLIKTSDIDAYFKYGFEEASEETNFFTGTIGQFNKVQIGAYVNKVVEDQSRYHFLIFENEIVIGEAVLMDIKNNIAHFRIALFDSENFSKGIGKSATKDVLTFGFRDLNLVAIELEVFPFNERGIEMYRKLGFKMVESVVDDDSENPYREINIMRLDKHNYFKEK